MRQPVGGAEAQAAQRHGASVFAARDQHDVAAELEQARAERSADRAGAVEDVSHGSAALAAATGNPSVVTPKSAGWHQRSRKPSPPTGTCSGLLAIAFGHGVNDFYSGTVALTIFSWRRTPACRPGIKAR